VVEQASGKTEMNMKRVSLVIVCLSMVLYSISGRAGFDESANEGYTADAKEAEQTIARRARQGNSGRLNRAILNKLSEMVHPAKGLRFSPYHSVNLEKHGDLVFSRRQVKV